MLIPHLLPVSLNLIVGIRCPAFSFSFSFHLFRQDWINAKHEVDQEVQRSAVALCKLREVEAARAQRTVEFGDQRLKLLDGLGGLLALHEDLRGALEGVRGPVAQAASFYHRQTAAVADAMVPADYLDVSPPVGTRDGMQNSLYASLATSSNPLSWARLPAHTVSQEQADSYVPVGPPLPLLRSLNGMMRLATQPDSTDSTSLLLPQGSSWLYGGATKGYIPESFHGGLQRRPATMQTPVVPNIRDSGSRESLVVSADSDVVGVIPDLPGLQTSVYSDRREYMLRR
jgi:hypothetical protein